LLPIFYPIKKEKENSKIQEDTYKEIPKDCPSWGKGPK